jgi:hypothetical protein
MGGYNLVLSILVLDYNLSHLQIVARISSCAFFIVVPYVCLYDTKGVGNFEL